VAGPECHARNGAKQKLAGSQSCRGAVTANSDVCAVCEDAGRRFAVSGEAERPGTGAIRAEVRLNLSWGGSECGMFCEGPDTELASIVAVAKAAALTPPGSWPVSANLKRRNGAEMEERWKRSRSLTRSAMERSGAFLICGVWLLASAEVSPQSFVGTGSQLREP
jgi:hypothetical protein